MGPFPPSVAWLIRSFHLLLFRYEPLLCPTPVTAFRCFCCKGKISERELT